MEKKLVLALKIIGWMKIPAMLVLGLVFFLPPNFIQTNAYIMSLIAQRSREMVRTDTAQDAEIRGLERRMDTLEEMRIDASIASMKATIEYDHTLLMTIAGAVLLMLLTHVLSFLRDRRGPGPKDPPDRKGYQQVFP